MDRGILTEKIKNKYEIDVTELRLIPYFQYLLLNGMPIDSSKISNEERQILQKWRDAGKITFSISHHCTCSKEHWDWMNEILWEAYCPKIGIDD